MEIIEIRTRTTEGLGTLSFLESKKDIPFEIKRIYYTYNVDEGLQRGGHAHKNLIQLLFCPYGSIEVTIDNGFSKEKIILDSPNKGLIIENGIWRNMIWKMKNSVLCVAASEYYNEQDYIRDYDEFLKYVKEGYWNNENKI